MVSGLVRERGVRLSVRATSYPLDKFTMAAPAHRSHQEIPQPSRVALNLCSAAYRGPHPVPYCEAFHRACQVFANFK